MLLISRLSTLVILILLIIGCQDTARVRDYRAGKHPPPPGYEYRKTETGELVQDNKGNPLFRKIGDPYVIVWKGKAFAPTPEEYERYKQLMQDKYQLAKQGKLVEAEQIATEIVQLKKASEREIPRIAVEINQDALADPTEVENAIRTLRKVFRDTYKAEGLGHLLPESSEER